MNIVIIDVIPSGKLVGFYGIYGGFMGSSGIFIRKYHLVNVYRELWIYLKVQRVIQ